MSISSELGYPDDSLEPTISLDRQALIDGILTRLTGVDESMANNTLDSMAIAIGDIKVDYQRNIRMLTLEGTRLLNQLSQLSGLAIAYDRFSQTRPTSGTHTQNPLSITSYW